MSDTEKALLLELARSEIAKIRLLPQPVVRVCGPLTCDGPAGYERNANRLMMAEEILQSRGATVWSFIESEKQIVGKGFDHDNIVTYFHKPVLASGLIRAAYFLPRSELSNGARRERSLCQEAGITTHEFLEEWFTQN